MRAEACASVAHENPVDQGTLAPLGDALTGYSVYNGSQQGWNELANGDLLMLPEATFDASGTTGQNLRSQQNSTGQRVVGRIRIGNF